MNFVHRDWKIFCLNTLSNFNCIRIDEIPKQLPNEPWVAIKHDVETNVKKAFEIAQIESACNIRATYFVQSYLLEDNYELLRKVADLGHEVSYHYDVLDANKGNMPRAIAEFTDTVARFEGLGFTINSVCPHGNPLIMRDGWTSNKDFFRNNEVVGLFPNIFDMVVQSSDVIKSKFLYISDAGYSWKVIGNIDSNDISNAGDIEITTYRDFVAMLESCNNVIVSSHPHRWCKNNASATLQLSKFKVVRFLAKQLAKNSLLKKFMSKFYFLAKKI
jgi:hypothetical protein